MKGKREVANFLQNLFGFQKCQSFCSTHMPETHCRHQKGHQWAVALISFLTFIHRTITAVKWGRQQTKVNFEKKNWKRKSGAQKFSTNYAISNRNKTRLKDVETKEIRSDDLDKTHQLILEKSRTKMFGHIQKINQKTPKTNHRKDFLLWKKNLIEQLLQMSVQADMMTTKRGTFQEIISRTNSFVVKSVFEHKLQTFQ